MRGGQGVSFGTKAQDIETISRTGGQIEIGEKFKM